MSFNIGDLVKVQVIAADPESGQIDFKFIEKIESGGFELKAQFDPEAHFRKVSQKWKERSGENTGRPQGRGTERDSERNFKRGGGGGDRRFSKNAGRRHEDSTDRRDRKGPSSNPYKKPGSQTSSIKASSNNRPDFKKSRDAYLIDKIKNTSEDNEETSEVNAPKQSGKDAFYSKVHKGPKKLAFGEKKKKPVFKRRKKNRGGGQTERTAKKGR